MRIQMYRKEKVKSDKIPPTKGAFQQHVLRAFHQIRQNSTSINETIDIKDPNECGWIRMDGQYVPRTSNTPIAPDSVVQLVSCKCTKGCKGGKCKCKYNNEPCTDFCGCGSNCQNTDPKMPSTAVEDIVDQE